MSSTLSQEEFVDFIPELVDYLATFIRTGNYSDKEILGFAAEYLEYEFGPDDWEKRAYVVVNTLLLKYKDEQKSWAAVTDCDRLDEVFEALSKTGILARQNYLCCSNCAAAAIVDEVDNEIISYGRRTKGYVYYDEQCTEGAVVYGKLHFGYGASNCSTAHSEQIGRMLVELLSSKGFEVNWSGSAADRISINIDWKRRTKSTLFSFWGSKENKNKPERREGHYVTRKPERQSSAPSFTDEEKALIGDWPSLMVKHFVSEEPDKVQIESEKLKIMTAVLNAKAQIATSKKSAARVEDVAAATGLHPFVIKTIDQILRYHIEEL